MARSLPHKLVIIFLFLSIFLAVCSVLAHIRNGTVESFKENFVQTCQGHDPSDLKRRICECLADQIIIQLNFLQLSILKNSETQQKYVKEYLDACVFVNQNNH